MFRKKAQAQFKHFLPFYSSKTRPSNTLHFYLRASQADYQPPTFQQYHQQEQQYNSHSVVQILVGLTLATTGFYQLQKGSKRSLASAEEAQEEAKEDEAPRLTPKVDIHANPFEIPKLIMQREADKKKEYEARQKIDVQNILNESEVKEMRVADKD